jgi:hypothetical protein
MSGEFMVLSLTILTFLATIRFALRQIASVRK